MASKDPKKVKQGKRNLAAGRRFERKIRKDLESKGWIVSRWQNNVEFKECVPAKQGRYRKTSTGFPDYLMYKLISKRLEGTKIPYKYVAYEIVFVECKSNGYLSKEEKEKASWYLENNYCSKFLIAKKSEKRGEIIYDDFSEKYKI